MKKLGATHLVSVSAVGSMKEEIAPGDLVDRRPVHRSHQAAARAPSSTTASSAHVAFADPVCPGSPTPRAARRARTRARASHRGGTYVCIEGPQFSTRAESRVYRSWGVSVIGMTNMPEAKLAREAELPYATLALATDYDCWHESEDDVSVEAVLAVLRESVETTKRLIAELAASLPDPRKSPAHGALQHAVLTADRSSPPNKRAELDWLLPKRNDEHEPEASSSSHRRVDGVRRPRDAHRHRQERGRRIGHVLRLRGVAFLARPHRGVVGDDFPPATSRHCRGATSTSPGVERARARRSAGRPLRHRPHEPRDARHPAQRLRRLRPKLPRRTSTRPTCCSATSTPRCRSRCSSRSSARSWSSPTR